MKIRWITFLLPLLLVFVLLSSSIKTADANFITDLPPPGYVFADSTSEENSPSGIIEPCDPDQESDISVTIINSSPFPPEGYATTFSRSTIPLSTATTLSDFPSYSWVFGCGAVSAAMIAGYYDRNGFPNMYAGPTNGGVMPLTDTVWPTWVDSAGDRYPNNPLIASKMGVDGRLIKGTIDNYWISYQSTAPDPFITYSWPEHTWGTTIGDFTKTSQSIAGNTDGQSVIYLRPDGEKLTCYAMENSNDCKRCNDQPPSECDITYGRKLFYEARGYTVTECYNQKTDNYVEIGGFTFSDFKAEIDSGHPVFVHVAGHFMVGYGYNGNNILIRDTWDNDPNQIITMPWGGSYQGKEMRSVGIVRLASANIKLSNNTVVEDQPIDTIVGTFSTDDPKNGDSHTYTLVSVTGNEDNNAFKVQGNQLLTAQEFDMFSKNNYYIRVRSTDQNGLGYEKPFTIIFNRTSSLDSFFLPLILRP